MKRSLLALSLALAAGGAAAATIDVTRFDDPAPNGCGVDGCSLREAVALANATPELDLVRLPAGAFVLSPQASGAVTIDVLAPLHIDGATRSTTIVRSTGAGSMLAAYADLRLRRMTLRDGVAIGETTTTGVAGAVRVHAVHLATAGVSFVNHLATMSGAIAIMDGSADFQGAQFTDNAAERGAGALSFTGSDGTITTSEFQRNEGLHGGAIMTGTSTLSISNHTSLHDNTARHGGAIASSDEILIDDTCDLSFNTATEAGGAYYGLGALRFKGVATPGGPGLVRVQGNEAAQGGAFAAVGRVEIERAAADDNRATRGGGLFYDDPRPMSIRDSRFSGNHATDAGGAIYTRGRGTWQRVSLANNSAGVHGGAVFVGFSAIIEASNLDVYGNTAPVSAAIRNSAALTLRHATFWNNRAGHALDVVHQTETGSTSYANSIVLGRCSGTTASISALGKNFRDILIGGSCSGSIANVGQLGLARGLYGHVFEVSGLKTSTSVAIDAGAPSQCVSDDVRGAPREPKCDVGAFEYGAAIP